MTSKKAPVYRCKADSEEILIVDRSGESRVLIPFFPAGASSRDLFAGRLSKAAAMKLGRKLAKTLNSGLADAVDALPVRA